MSPSGRRSTSLCTALPYCPLPGYGTSHTPHIHVLGLHIWEPGRAEELNVISPIPLLPHLRHSAFFSRTLRLRSYRHIPPSYLLVGPCRRLYNATATSLEWLFPLSPTAGHHTCTLAYNTSLSNVPRPPTLLLCLQPVLSCAPQRHWSTPRRPLPLSSYIFVERKRSLAWQWALRKRFWQRITTSLPLIQHRRAFERACYFQYARPVALPLAIDFASVAARSPPSRLQQCPTCHAFIGRYIACHLQLACCPRDASHSPTSACPNARAFNVGKYASHHSCPECGLARTGRSISIHFYPLWKRPTHHSACAIVRSSSCRYTRVCAQPAPFSSPFECFAKFPPNRQTEQHVASRWEPGERGQGHSYVIPVANASMFRERENVHEGLSESCRKLI
jgi:hypothetical protein